MRKTSLILINLILLFFAFNIKAEEVRSYECVSESGTADEVIHVRLDHSKKSASIFVENKGRFARNG